MNDRSLVVARVALSCAVLTLVATLFLGAAAIAAALLLVTAG